jgi:small subunit ribosomal protein S4e
MIFSVIGKEKPWISLPKGKGVKLSISEERDRRRAYHLAGN